MAAHWPVYDLQTRCLVGHMDTNLNPALPIWKMPVHRQVSTVFPSNELTVAFITLDILRDHAGNPCGLGYTRGDNLYATGKFTPL